VLANGILVDTKGAIIKLQQAAAERVNRQGMDMAKQRAVVALCEKNLVAFLRDFISKQPGVKVVPQITVRYIGAPPAPVAKTAQLRPASATVPSAASKPTKTGE
jgi:hypothetical protein